MNTKKKRNTKTDWKKVAQSMYCESETLFQKLKKIWDLAHLMIEFVDENHPTPINNVLQQYKANFTTLSPDDASSRRQENELKDIANDTSAHYVMIHRLDMDYENSLIAESYFGALGMIGRIQTATNFVARYSHECRKSRVNTFEFIEKILCHDTQIPHSFMNEVVPLFFSLQLHCHNLVEIANPPAGAPADPRIRKSRALSAADSKNYGEDVLKGMILKFLNDQEAKTKYKKVDELFLNLADGLKTTLDNYLGLLDSPTEAGGPPLRYGKNPAVTIYTIPRKLKEWKNEDLEFKKGLERLCVIK